MHRLTDDRDRARSLLAAVVLTGALGAALLLGLVPPSLRPAIDDLPRFTLLPDAEPPPPKPLPKREEAPRPKGAAAPANRVSRAAELVVPPPIVPPPLPPPPLAVAPIAATGPDRSSGAAPVAGPGTGAGGQGTGLGSGDGGDGDGGGGGGSDAVQVAGRISGRDYPAGPLRAHIQGRVTIHYVITVRGRVEGCRVVRSSGNAELDETTCRLVTQRFRFRPARDAAGRKVPDELTEDHTWVVDGDDPPADD